MSTQKTNEELFEEWEDESFKRGSELKNCLSAFMTACNIKDEAIKQKDAEIERLKDEYTKISCAYCGTLCARDPDELVKHIEKCEKHPVFYLFSKIDKRDKLLETAYLWIKNPEGTPFVRVRINWLKDYEELKK